MVFFQRHDVDRRTLAARVDAVVEVDGLGQLPVRIKREIRTVEEEDARAMRHADLADAPAVLPDVPALLRARRGIEVRQIADVLRAVRSA